ncbi:MAG: septum formation initiator family protein [Rhizobiaceae bacterium]
MWTRQYKKRNTGKFIIPALCASFLAYFGFHAFHGEYGIYAKYRLETGITELKAERDALKSERIALEQRVRLLHDGTIDKDMLDEQARKSLNLSHADEVVIMRPFDDNAD